PGHLDEDPLDRPGAHDRGEKAGETFAIVDLGDAAIAVPEAVEPKAIEPTVADIRKRKCRRGPAQTADAGCVTLARRRSLRLELLPLRSPQDHDPLFEPGRQVECDQVPIDRGIAMTDGRYQLPALRFGVRRAKRIDPAAGLVEGFAAPDHLREDEPVESLADATVQLFLEQRSSVTEEGPLAPCEAELFEDQPHQLMALRPCAAVPVAAREQQQPRALR